MRDAVRHAIETDRMGRDPEFATFINTTLGSRLMPQMAREKSGDDEVSIAFPLRRKHVDKIFLFVSCAKCASCFSIRDQKKQAWWLTKIVLLFIVY